jgi:uncharacterized Zn-binding protein involved in type VI secretion
MAIGYFIGIGDTTSCGGEVLEGEPGMMFGSMPRAYEGHRVSCGANGRTYTITGGIDSFKINGQRAAGTLDSTSTCPCKATFNPSITNGTYQSAASNEARVGTANSASSSALSVGANPSPRPSPFTAPAPPIAPALAGVDPAPPGFYIVAKTISRDELQASLFPSPSAAVLNKFHSLNPGSDLVKAGSIIVLSDPNNQQCTREEAMLTAAAAKANEVADSLSADEADFMMRHRDEISTFLGYGSTAVGVGEVMFARHLKSVENLFKEMNDLHRQSLQKHGHLRAPEFFAERKRLLTQLDLHMNGFMRKGIGLQDHPKLKSALGISSRSLVHHWSHAGVVDSLPGHATHMSALANASKVIRAGGWVGTAVGGGASYLKVQEVCASGGIEACKRVRYTETGGFLGSLTGGVAGAALMSGPIVTGICVGLGVPTGGLGTIACGVIVVGVASAVGGQIGARYGEDFGELIHEVGSQ